MRPGGGVFRNDDRRSEDAKHRSLLPEIGATGFVPTEFDNLVLEPATGDSGREAASPSARYDLEHSSRGGTAPVTWIIKIQDQVRVIRPL